MVKIYAELIKKGVKTLEEVPEKIRKEVKERRKISWLLFMQLLL